MKNKILINYFILLLFLILTSLNESTAKKNIILINLDDDAKSTIDYYLDSLPNIKLFLKEQGLYFKNYIDVTPVCGPSRVSLLTGQFTHNTGYFENDPPTGTFENFYNKYGENELGMWMKNANYKTVLVGKYQNRWPGGGSDTLIPKGWQHAMTIGQYYYNSFLYQVRMSEGVPIKSTISPACANRTFVEYNFMARFMDSCFVSTKPFFIYYAPFVPHRDTSIEGNGIPSEFFINDFSHDSLKNILPTNVFNENDISDKAAGIANLPKKGSLGQKQTDNLFRNRMRGMKDFDMIFGEMILKLQYASKLDSTYIILTSDNGHSLLEHRLISKPYPYEESLSPYLFVRGPGVPQNQSRDHLIANIDIAPTMLDIAGGVSSVLMDGKSMLPLWGSNPPTLESWRKHLICSGIPPSGTRIPKWWALRGNGYKLIRWDSITTANQNVLQAPIGWTYEYYDLYNDPYELNSSLSMSNQSDTLMLFYHQKIDTLNLMLQCAGPSCY